MTSLHLRRYGREDRGGCLLLFEGNIPGSFFPHEIPGFMEFLDSFTGPYLVVKDAANNLVACGGVAGQRDCVTLCWGMVARDRQRQGIGRCLLRARLALAAASPGVRLVNMNTAQRTALFFEREGFTTRQVTANGYGPGVHRHDMELRLMAGVRQQIVGYAEALRRDGHWLDPELFTERAPAARER